MPSPRVPSAKLLARRAAKVVLNYQALAAIDRAMADGAFDLAKSVIVAASPKWPPSPPGSPMAQWPLRTKGGVLVYVDKKLVRAWSLTGEVPKKPRRARLTPGITVIAGFGFPAKFNEAGTVHQPARPVLTPELMHSVPGAEGFFKLAAVKHKVISEKRAAVRALVGAVA